ncbi:hypothetical protein G6F58_012725 [Rhizopus delemar]|nr:hypothetical protein G6F58_012725 [Rhizopus delemar]
MLAGFEEATSGQILLDGEDITSVPPYRRPVNMMFQSYALWPHKTVFENVAYPLKLRKVPSAEVRERVQAVLDQLGLGKLGQRHPHALSGGQQQRVAIGRALVYSPPVILLDEPLSALDLNYQFHVMRLLKQETQEHRLISIIVLHDLNVALQHADRAVMISSGRLHAEGAPAEVITPASLAAVYGVQGRVEACSRGLRQVLIDGLDEHPR